MYLFGGSKSTGAENKNFYALDLKSFRWDIIHSVIYFKLNSYIREGKFQNQEMSTQFVYMKVQWLCLVALLVESELTKSIVTTSKISNGNTYSQWVINVRLQEQATQLLFMEIIWLYLEERMKKIIN